MKTTIEKPETADETLDGGLLSPPPCPAWISCDNRPPIGEDFGCFFHSVDVLFTNGKYQWVGYLQTWEEEEYEPIWKMKGPDGWDVKNVTHWMPLPYLPHADGQPRRGAT